jgi:N-acetyl-gamma-glutamyl-phosphate reductase
MPEKSAAVIGATGYAGATAVALLSDHPHVRLTAVTSRSYAGRRLGDACPGLVSDLVLGAEPDPGDAEIVVVALPHGMAGALAARWRREGRTVVDLGADFRLRDPGEHARWYGAEHPAPELLAEAVLGLPEVAGEGLRGAGLIACPGCYSTAAVLALRPAVASGLARPDFVVDAASGVSGAGRSLSLGTHFSEVDADFKAYSVGGHRHLPEITQALADASPGATSGAPPAPAPRVTFVPHLVPMVRGILATCYFDLAPGATIDALRQAYREAYAGMPFVAVVDAPPRTKEVAGTNLCRIHVTEQGGRAIVLAAIDNLVKGASGQAVQALNVAMGWPEAAGLERAPRWP